MKKYSIPSNAYKNQLFSKAVQNKYNLLRMKTKEQTPMLKLNISNYVAS